MDLTLDGLQVNAFSSILKGSGNEVNKTALNLLEQIQGITNETSTEKTQKMVELVIDEKAGTLIVSGIQGPVKIFSNTRKLLLIRTAQGNQAHFKIGHLKKGRYILEAEHQFFEFVR